MATGGCDPSITDGHEFFYEHRCNKCEDKDCITEATAYCRNCNECYCDSCLGDHNRFIRGHTVLREADKDDWGKPVPSQDSGMECSEHKGQYIAMYCGHHDVVCCPVCAYLHHGEICKPNMSYIPTVAQGVVSSAEFKNFIAANDALLVRLMNTEKTRTDCLSKLDTSRERCTKDIEVIGQDLTHRIEELQHISFADMNNKVDDEKNMIQADIAQCVELRQELNLIQQQMQLSHQVNESSVFVKMKTGGKIHLNCEEVCTVLSNKKMKTFLIKPDSSLQRLFLTNSLGECTENVQEVVSINPDALSKHLNETCMTRVSSDFQQLDVDATAESSTLKQMFNVRQENLKVTKRRQRQLAGTSQTSIVSEHTIDDVIDRGVSEKLIKATDFQWSKDASNQKCYKTDEGILVFVYNATIVKLPVDCIVNSANENLQHGGGVAKVIADAAGFELTRESDAYIKHHIVVPVGMCCTTTAGRLPYKAVIHTVGPKWSNYRPHSLPKVKKCEEDLYLAIHYSLLKAESEEMASVALPPISSAIFGVPEEMCTYQYAKATVDYSKKSIRAKKPLKEIHFVDINVKMIKRIQERFDAFVTQGKPPEYDIQNFVMT